MQFLEKEDCLFGKSYSSNQSVLLFGNPDQAVQKLVKVKTTAVHLWKEILETVVTMFCCLLKKCCSLYDFKFRR